MKKVNWENYDEARELLKNAIDIRDYYKEYIDNNIDLRLRTLTSCPLHDEKTASFKYYSESNTFYCFGCEKGGSVTELHYHLVRRDDDTFTKPKAVIELSKAFHIEIPNLFEKSCKLAKRVKVGEYKQGLNIEPKKPIKWLISEIEKELKILKNKNKERYIKMCNELDNVLLLNEDLDNKLNEIIMKLR